MDVWGWGSPIAWALFLMACGATAVLLSVALKFVSHASVKFMSLPPAKKR